MESAFSKTTEEVLKHFSVTETQGLSEAQIAASREKYGRNGMYGLCFVKGN
jgi:Ca2+ transporting ATPase